VKLYGRKSWAPWFRAAAENRRPTPILMGFDVGREPARQVRSDAWHKLRARLAEGSIALPDLNFTKEN